MIAIGWGQNSSRFIPIMQFVLTQFVIADTFSRLFARYARSEKRPMTASIFQDFQLRSWVSCILHWFCREPITQSEQIPRICFTVHSQTSLFLDRFWRKLVVHILRKFPRRLTKGTDQKMLLWDVCTCSFKKKSGILVNFYELVTIRSVVSVTWVSVFTLMGHSLESGG